MSNNKSVPNLDIKLKLQTLNKKLKIKESHHKSRRELARSLLDIPKPHKKYHSRTNINSQIVSKISTNGVSEDYTDSFLPQIVQKSE
jgi:hypothetical protein